MQEIILHYRSYISAHSKRTYYDKTGNSYEIIDEDIQQRIESKLMYQIYFHFDPYKKPE